MKKVTEEFPDDVEAWIELAAILENSDVPVSVVQFRYPFIHRKPNSHVLSSVLQAVVL